jgi:hypothetical protein
MGECFGFSGGATKEGEDVGSSAAGDFSSLERVREAK